MGMGGYSLTRNWKWKHNTKHIRRWDRWTLPAKVPSTDTTSQLYPKAALCLHLHHTGYIGRTHAVFAIFSINNKNLAIANKPRDAATLFQIKKDDLEMTLKRSLKVIANNTMGFPIQYNTKFVMHRCHRILRKTNQRRNIPHQTAVDLELEMNKLRHCIH